MLVMGAKIQHFPHIKTLFLTFLFPRDNQGYHLPGDGFVSWQALIDRGAVNFIVGFGKTVAKKFGGEGKKSYLCSRYYELVA